MAIIQGAKPPGGAIAQEGPAVEPPLGQWARANGIKQNTCSWRARQDSNLRPSAPEADALSAELQARGHHPSSPRSGRAQNPG